MPAFLHAAPALSGAVVPSWAESVLRSVGVEEGGNATLTGAAAVR